MSDTPTPEPGAELLSTLRDALTRYVVMPSEFAVDAVVLWIACSHAQPAWAHAPRLVIRAPERRCGKSRLLDIVEATCHNPLITVNASPAAVYRSINDDPPVLLVDEADTIFGAKADGNEELRGVLNAGHQRDRPALRYDAATQVVQHIPTFAMAALAGIGAMPDTIEDRAVVVHMRRKAPGERAAAYRSRRDRAPLRTLAEQLTEWLRADLNQLEHAVPDMPVEDRAADTWEPLITVADHAGGEWPGRARTAALAMTQEAEETAEMSDRMRLLIDCRAAFGTDGAIATTELLQRLRKMLESPWADYGPHGLSPAKLSSMLREYGIRPHNVRLPDGSQRKGYDRGDFADSWHRYCPQDDDLGNPSHPSHPSSPWSARDGSHAWDGPSRPSDSHRPAPTGDDTPHTAGTDETTYPLHVLPDTA